jgi:serine/threonine-protein kinase HipA
MNVQPKKLTVTYNHQVVGYLADIDHGKIAFQYADSWIQNGFSISPFSLPLSHQIYISTSPHFRGLFGVFHHSLPGGWGGLLARRKLALKGIQYDNLSPLSQLALLSEEGLGGLQYEPTQNETSQRKAVDLDVLANEIKQLVNHSITNLDLEQLFLLGGSSGGARPKVHLRINDAEWIVKFPSSFDPEDIGRSEFLSNQLAKQSGIRISDVQLFMSKRNQGYFGSKRFDRQDGQRIHMISLSALLETTHAIPNLDYLHLFQVIQKISLDQEDLYEAYRRMCFNVLHKNRDDHGNNHAFLYDEFQKGYRLSPAFDLTKTASKPEHEMTVLGEGKPQIKDLIKIAEEMRLSKPKCDAILMQVIETLTNANDS